MIVEEEILQANVETPTTTTTATNRLLSVHSGNRNDNSINNINTIIVRYYCSLTNGQAIVPGSCVLVAVVIQLSIIGVSFYIRNETKQNKKKKDISASQTRLEQTMINFVDMIIMMMLVAAAVVVVIFFDLTFLTFRCSLQAILIVLTVTASNTLTKRSVIGHCRPSSTDHDHHHHHHH